MIFSGVPQKEAGNKRGYEKPWLDNTKPKIVEK